jgi:hypothetical protein
VQPTPVGETAPTAHATAEHTLVAPAAATAAGEAAGPPAAAPPTRRRRPRVIAAVALVLVAAAAAVVTILASGGGDTSFAEKAKDAVSGLTRANGSLSQHLTSLTPGTRAATLVAATDSTAAAAGDAQRRVAALDAKDDPALAGGLKRAISAEQAYLAQAKAAATAPSRADASALQRAGASMADAFAAIRGKLSALTPVSGVERLLTWVRDRQTQGKRRQGVDTFIGAVDAVLATARPGRAQIGQIKTAMDNGTITPDAARTGIDQVVANRQNALQQARALPVTPDPAEQIKSQLVDSFQASLDYDRDLQDGIAAYESGDFGRYINKVFDDAKRSNDAATNAKRAFLGAYNQLRSSRGQPAVADDF